MKKQLQKMFLIALLIVSIYNVNQAQTVSTFENLSLTADTYWDGSGTPLGTTFTSGNVIFPNFYDTSYGGYWATGWAYSNMNDTLTSGFFNMFSTYAGSGFSNSAIFAVGTQGSVLELTGNALGKVVGGFYITNGTYAALSMKEGDFSGKKFGGTSGDDPDWFKLTVHAYYNGSLKNDSVEFYLADYRFTDNQLDYIVKNWEWVSLISLGNVDSLMFSLSSSDNGTWGMNTPAFFCMDNFTTLDSEVGMNTLNDNTITFNIYPNPCTDFVTIETKNAVNYLMIEVFDIHGKLMWHLHTSDKSLQMPVGMLSSGFYFLKIYNHNFVVTKSFIKN